MRIPFLATALGLSLVACVDPAPTSQVYTPVIGGQLTPEGEFPGVGALYMSSFGGFSCTGTLIAPDVVLTAAHCVDPLLIGSEVPGFTLAHDTVTTVPQVTSALDAIPHENFDIQVDPGTGPGIWYDIALLILSEPITSVPPVRLPSVAEGETLQTGSEMILVGYGVTEDPEGGGGGDSGRMYDALTDLVIRGSHELQISTPGAPQNCYGDSGGPGLFDINGTYRVVGVVSRSAGGSSCSAGGIDTRVDAFLDWINTNAPQVCIPGEECSTATPDAAPPPPDAAPPTPDAAIPDPPDAGGPGIDDDSGGCCSTSGDPSGSVLLALGVGLLIMRRRRR
jgi:MYXO-CTERM domain-containing protein